jgi:hypothetical protein
MSGSSWSQVPPETQQWQCGVNTLLQCAPPIGPSGAEQPTIEPANPIAIGAHRRACMLAIFTRLNMPSIDGKSRRKQVRLQIGPGTLNLANNR